jgi:hypothetical protein
MGGLTFVGVIPLRNFPLKDGPPQGNFRFAGHPLIKHLEGSIECIGDLSLAENLTDTTPQRSPPALSWQSEVF